MQEMMKHAAKYVGGRISHELDRMLALAPRGDRKKILRAQRSVAKRFDAALVARLWAGADNLSSSADDPRRALRRARLN